MHSLVFAAKLKYRAADSGCTFADSIEDSVTWNHMHIQAIKPIQ